MKEYREERMVREYVGEREIERERVLEENKINCEGRGVQIELNVL